MKVFYTFLNNFTKNFVNYVFKDMKKFRLLEFKNPIPEVVCSNSKDRASFRYLRWKGKRDVCNKTNALMQAKEVMLKFVFKTLTLILAYRSINFNTNTKSTYLSAPRTSMTIEHATHN
jgi:hypothetical protein